ncbi:MAG: exonuclease subunit SbcD [Pseudanabaenaceae cyanobacterium SKYGB_i_bin29]|nr:exonuclease subunit SbcD [Pseudanabaenaceae cyanobacterium SKYG29]MDW8421751.1 exonuclease subunit SbcD [Pseudanabaenaceae cyanobacterium SKYGB_i_bin29]
MTIKVLHLADIHLGSLAHGKVNPTTGVNSRLEDFTRSLSLCIDRAITEPADLVLFAGDAFPDAVPPPYVQQAFAQQFRRLADAHIPTVLLVGNHDQHCQGLGGASLVIYRSLGVPGFIVGDTIATHTISTRGGKIQVITVPWLTRSALLTKQETQGLSVAEVGDLLLEKLTIVLEAEIRRLDPNLPTVLLGHMMIDTATYGAERFLAAGKGFTIPLSLVARSEFAYVALGHVHRHQVLCQEPPVVYPGSIERVDFGEETEEKGYCWVEISKRQTKFTFCPLPARQFRTISVDLTNSEQPLQELLKTIGEHNITDTIVRLRYQIKPEQVSSLDQHLIHQALASAHTYKIIAEVQETRPRIRLPDLTPEQVLDPLSALKHYLSKREDLRSLESDLISAAQTLLEPAGGQLSLI